MLLPSTLSFFSLLFIFCLFSDPNAFSVAGQTAGAGLWAASLSNSPTSPPPSWATISQSYKKEWDALANCFTVEIWVNWRGPQAGINREVIISRHPGNNAIDARAHFGIGLLPNPQAPNQWNINAWSGCYTALGFDLNSLRAFSGSSHGYFITPGVWTHIAFVVGGDATFLPDAVGQLYVQGDLQDSNFWDSTHCTSKVGIPWDKNSHDVRLGWYDNQDLATPGTPTPTPTPGNPNWVYGFNGLVDEVMFFSRVRTHDELFRDFSLSFELMGSEPSLLYFQLNEGPRGEVGEGPHLGSQTFYKKKNSSLTGPAAHDMVGPLGMLVPGSPSQWVQGTSLTINQNLLVVAKSPLQSANQVASVTLLSSNEIAPIKFTLTSFSPDLLPLVNTGQVRVLVAGGNGVPVLPKDLPLALPSSSSPTLQVMADCTDVKCKNIFGSLFIGFSANQSPAKVQLTVTNPCASGVYDACGVCNGDNRTCMCLCYHGFRTSFLGHQLFQFGTNQTLLKIQLAVDYLRKLMDQIGMAQSGNKIAQGQVIEEVRKQENYFQCHSKVCNGLGPWKARLDSLMPLPEATGLPFDSCNCDPDPTINI